MERRVGHRPDQIHRGRPKRPELVRSWVSDALSLFEPDYVWHDLAQLWQTPGDGEAHLDELVFRFDRRHTPHAAFARLLGLGLEPATRQILVARS